ncbi:MAG: hypothetical protein ACK5NT_11710 [Pyrinomonadaceae bacterium]
MTRIFSIDKKCHRLRRFTLLLNRFPTVGTVGYKYIPVFDG